MESALVCEIPDTRGKTRVLLRSVLFLSDIAFKALLTTQVNMFLFDGAIYKY